MKILSWNCNMAFRKKYEKILIDNPDVLIIQECENKLLLEEFKDKIGYSEIYWYGDNKHKGISSKQKYINNR